jgi:hypothetical protein
MGKKKHFYSVYGNGSAISMEGNMEVVKKLKKVNIEL